MIELTQLNRSAHSVANVAATAQVNNKTQSALPSCATKQMLVPKTLEFDLQRLTAESTADNSSNLEYMPLNEVQTLGTGVAVNRILDSVLRDHANLLSDNAKTAIQPGGRIRKYLFEKSTKGSRGAELFAVFNQFLGTALKLKNTSLSKASLESILGLPNSELNCLDGMYERIAIVKQNMSSASSLPKRLHLNVVEKLFSRIEQQSPGLSLGIQIHRRWNANHHDFLSAHQGMYQNLMVDEINQLISEEIEPVLKSIENVVYEQGVEDPYSLLKKLGENKADLVGLFHPHVPDTERGESNSADEAGQGMFHETRAYFGDPDEDTFLPVRLNRDQIYSNLFSRLRNHIEPVSKIAVVLSNPECAVGLAKGIFNSTEKSLLDLTDAELSLSNNDDFITAERNNALLGKIRARLPVYLSETSSNLDVLLENKLIDVKSMLQSPSFKQNLNNLLVLPFLEKQESTGPSNNHGSVIQVTNYKKTIDQSKIQLLTDVAIKFYALAVIQGVNSTKLTQLKASMISQCEDVDWTELHKLEKACQQVERVNQGFLDAAKDVHAYLLDNKFPDGTLSTTLKDNMALSLIKDIKTIKINVAIERFHMCKDVLNPTDFTDVSCALLKRLSELDQTKANNQMACQALDDIQSYYFKGLGAATPELALKAMVAVAQNMGKFRAAKLLSSPQTIASGGLVRNQDPQTRAYKLMKRYLMSQVSNGQLKMSFVKELWKGNAIGELSDSTRSLSAGHWKRILTSLALNSMIYGMTFGMTEIWYLENGTREQIGAAEQSIQDLVQSMQEAEANIEKAESELAQLQASKLETEAMIADLENKNTEWIESANTSDEAYELSLAYENEKLTELNNQITEKEQGLAQLITEQTNNFAGQTQDLAQKNAWLAEQKEQIKIANVRAALFSEYFRLKASLMGAALGMREEVKTWGPVGAIQTVHTVYTASKEKNPLASVRDAAVRLTPAAIEHFVLQAAGETTSVRLEGATDAWKQVLSGLNNKALKLSNQQKAGLVVDFVKQFSTLGRFKLNEEQSRQAIYSVLDSLEACDSIKAVLPEILQQSKSTSVTVMKYFLDKHDEAQQNQQSDGILPELEIERFSKLLGVKRPLQTGLAVEHSRLAAAKIHHNIRPAWASPAVLAAAVRRKPVKQAIESVKVSRDERIQQLQGRLDTSKALYERMNRLPNRNKPQ